MNEKEKKRKEIGEKLYTINFTTEERESYKKVSKEQGHRTLASFIRECLDIVTQNPSILNPTQPLDSEVIKQITKELKKPREKKTRSKYYPYPAPDQKFPPHYAEDHEYLEIPKNSRIGQHLVTTRYLDLIARKVGATEQEIKLVNRRDQAGVAVFEKKPVMRSK